MSRFAAWLPCIVMTTFLAVRAANAMSDVQGFVMPTWLTGTWTGGSAIMGEEIWSTPLGNSMIGMWRAVESGKAKAFELAAIIADEAGGAQLQLHHFDANGGGWQNKDKPVTLGFVKQTRNSVVFEGREAQDYVRITYVKAGAAELTVILEKNPTASSTSTTTYRFRKKR